MKLCPVHLGGTKEPRIILEQCSQICWGGCLQISALQGEYGSMHTSQPVLQSILLLSPNTSPLVSSIPSLLGLASW